MTSSRIVFHHPLPLSSQGLSGSQVRPVRMLAAFRELGYEVDLVAGYASERQAAIRGVEETLRADRNAYQFVYSESSTTPTLLTERHHFPTHPFLDFSFLGKLRKAGIPVGLFYRDIYWRTDFYKEFAPLRHRLLTLPMYYYDLAQYRRVLDHLFLPALEMAEYLPGSWPPAALSALPPGCTPRPIPASQADEAMNPLSLLYIGGIVPPLYDLRAIIGAIANRPGVRLTLCCRPKDWEDLKSLYLPLPDNVTVVHASGEALESLYRNAHLALINHINWYHHITVPVKYYESVGYGVPALLVGNSVLARQVKAEGLGWVAEEPGVLADLLETIRRSPEEMQRKRCALVEAQERHSWKSRAAQVAATLTRQGGAAV